ncbi:MAG: NACHT domain-containing protein [Gammaproteobacteria bacterium]
MLSSSAPTLPFIPENAQDNEVMLRAQGLRLQQQMLSSPYHENTEEPAPSQLLMRALTQIRNKLNNSTHTSLFISYAWPTKERAYENWIQPFLTKLYEHLTSAGMTVYMDQLDSRSGFNTIEHMNRINTVDLVMLVGSESLLDKHHDGTKNICTELNLIRRRRSNQKSVMPIILSGNMETALPAEYERYTAVEFAYEMSYASLLKTIINKCISITHPNNNTSQYWDGCPLEWFEPLPIEQIITALESDGEMEFHALETFMTKNQQLILNREHYQPTLIESLHQPLSLLTNSTALISTTTLIGIIACLATNPIFPIDYPTLIVASLCLLGLGKIAEKLIDHFHKAHIKQKYLQLLKEKYKTYRVQPLFTTISKQDNIYQEMLLSIEKRRQRFAYSTEEEEIEVSEIKKSEEEFNELREEYIFIKSILETENENDLFSDKKNNDEYFTKEIIEENLSAYEEVAGTVTEEDLNNRDDTRVNQHQLFSQLEKSLSTYHILIEGEAGVGKSTWMRQLTKQSVESEEWSDKEIFILAEVRHIQHIQATSETEILRNLLDLPEDENTIQEINTFLEMIENENYRVWWCIDGYDEVQKNTQNQLFRNLLDRLMQKPFVIVTSRPTNINFDYDVAASLDGFVKSQIQAYIIDYFRPLVNENDVANLYSFIGFIDSYLKGFLTNPMLLELACYLYTKNLFTSDSIKHSHDATPFYRQSILTLSRNWLDKTTRAYEDEEYTEKQIEDICEPLLAFMRTLAAETKKQETHIIPNSIIQKAWSDHETHLITSNITIEDCLVNFGLLRPITHERHLLQRDYMFPHANFQDYFAAEKKAGEISLQLINNDPIDMDTIVMDILPDEYHTHPYGKFLASLLIIKLSSLPSDINRSFIEELIQKISGKQHYFHPILMMQRISVILKNVEWFALPAYLKVYLTSQYPAAAILNQFPHEYLKNMPKEKIQHLDALIEASVICSLKNILSAWLPLIKLEEKGMRLITSALLYCNTKIANYLIEQGARFEITQFNEVRKHRLALIPKSSFTWLLEKGIDLNQTRLLHSACMERSTEIAAISKLGNHTIIDALLRRGADINLPDHAGNTPLFSAHSYNRYYLYSLIRKLLSCGADYTLRNNRHENILIHFAQSLLNNPKTTPNVLAIVLTYDWEHSEEGPFFNENELADTLLTLDHIPCPLGEDELKDALLDLQEMINPSFLETSHRFVITYKSLKTLLLYIHNFLSCPGDFYAKIESFKSDIDEALLARLISGEKIAEIFDTPQRPLPEWGQAFLEEFTTRWEWLLKPRSSTLETKESEESNDSNPTVSKDNLTPSLETTAEPKEEIEEKQTKMSFAS